MGRNIEIGLVALEKIIGKRQGEKRVIRWDPGFLYQNMQKKDFHLQGMELATFFFIRFFGHRGFLIRAFGGKKTSCNRVREVQGKKRPARGTEQ